MRAGTLVAQHPGVHVGGETLHHPRQIAPLGGGPIGHHFTYLLLARLVDDGDDLAAGLRHRRFAHALVARAGAARHQVKFFEPRHLPLMLPQYLTEGVLRDRLAELGHAPRFGHELTRFEQDGEGVTAQLAKADGTTITNTADGAKVPTKSVCVR